MSNIIDQLMQTFGDKSVLTGSAIGDKYKKDWSGVDGRLPIAVVRPTSTEEVSQVLSLCSEQSQAVVIQGGMTGISAGAVPQEQEIAISLERMNGIIEIDKESMTLTALAGTPLQVIQEAAEDADMYFPLDMGSRGTCTIGGNVATNAGGNQVIPLWSGKSVNIRLRNSATRRYHYKFT